MRKAGFICSRMLPFTGWYNKSCYNTVIGRPGYIKTLEKARNTQPVDALPRNTAQNKSDALILSIIPTAAPVKAPMPGRGRVTSRNTDHRHKSRLLKPPLSESLFSSLRRAERFLFSFASELFEPAVFFSASYSRVQAI